MDVFEYIFNEANFDVDQLHLYREDASGVCVPQRLLTIAATAGNFKVVQFMINLGANVDCYKSGETLRHPLFDAIFGEKLYQNRPITPQGYEKIVTLLLSKGVKPDTTINNISAFEYARTDYLSVHSGNLEYIKGAILSHNTPDQCEASMKQYIADTQPSFFGYINFW